jgi:hypothetical protein
VTLDVLKLLKSKEVKEEHPRNIYFILSALDVSKLLKSKDVRDLQL